MEIRVGTSGFSYAPWKGRFYPKESAGVTNAVLLLGRLFYG